MSQHREKVEIGSLGEELYGGAGGISMDKAVRGGLACSTLDRHCFETPNSWVASLSELTAISDHLVNAIQTDQCIVYVSYRNGPAFYASKSLELEIADRR